VAGIVPGTRHFAAGAEARLSRNRWISRAPIVARLLPMLRGQEETVMAKLRLALLVAVVLTVSLPLPVLPTGTGV
jgi:hypothetical protein